MDEQTVTTWLELENYLASLTGTDLSIIINLNMAQDEANPTGAAKLIDFPANVKAAQLNSVDPAIIYNLRITTSRTTHFELTIKDLQVQLTTSNHIIDIANVEYVGADVGENFNKLNLSGTNIMYNAQNGCVVHVGVGYGLYIKLMESSVSRFGLVNNTVNISATIGGLSGEDGGSIFVLGSGSVIVQPFRGAGIGGGGAGDRGIAGDGGNIEIYDSAKITVNPFYGAGIGGGACGNLGTPGNGGNIKIYGNASITGQTAFTSAIGAGAGIFNDGGSSGNIEIYGDATVDVSTKYTAIGGGFSLMGSGGSGDSIKIYGNANVTTNVTNNGCGIGGGYTNSGTGGNAGTIEIKDNAVVTVNTANGIGIGAAKNSDGTLTGTGTVIISTTGLVTIPKNENDDLAIGGGPSCIVTISGDVPMDIPGGIAGLNFNISDKKIIVDELIYKTADYTGSLTFSDGYIVVNKKVHEQYPVNRGDYFVVMLTSNGVPYTSPVKLESVAPVINILADEAPLEITPNDDGSIQIYISDGEYYFASTDGAYKTEDFTVDTNITHDNPELPLEMNFGGGTFTGHIEWYKDSSHGPEEKISVTLYSEDNTKTNYGCITDSNGDYSIGGVDIGKYYVGFSNIPTDYLFVSDGTSIITESGVTKLAYEISESNVLQEINADIRYNAGAKGTIGPKGADGVSFPSAYINMLKFDGQIVNKNSDLNLGDVIYGNGDSISYSVNKNVVILSQSGSYMVNFSAHTSFINTHDNKDYLAIQLKQGNNFLKHGFSYCRSEGVLYGSLIVKNFTTGGNNNELQLINVGTKGMVVDNLDMIVLKIS